MMGRLTKDSNDWLPTRSGTRASALPDAPLAPMGETLRDRDVPVFALLRATMGLPRDDLRWWPEGPEDVAPSRHAPRHAVTLVSGGVRVNAEFETPTVALLERILAALRSLETPAGAGRLRPVGRHELAVG